MHFGSMARVCIALLATTNSIGATAESVEESRISLDAKAEGVLSCQVIGNAIHIAKEGKYIEADELPLGHFKQVKIGERLDLIYSANRHEAKISLKKEIGAGDIFRHRMSDFDQQTNPNGVQKTYDNLGIVLEQNDGIPAFRLMNMAIHPESIRATNQLGTKLHLSRYYKGDWSGLLIDSELPGIQRPSISITALDCKTVKDDIDLAIRILKTRIRNN